MCVNDTCSCYGRNSKHNDLDDAPNVSLRSRERKIHAHPAMGPYATFISHWYGEVRGSREIFQEFGAHPFVNRRASMADVILLRKMKIFLWGVIVFPWEYEIRIFLGIIIVEGASPQFD